MRGSFQAVLSEAGKKLPELQKVVLHGSSD